MKSSLLWAKMHKADRDLLVGSDEFDLSIGKNGLPAILNPTMIIARKRARAWLVQQPDAELIYFSMDSTMSMLVEQIHQARQNWITTGKRGAEPDAWSVGTDQEVDAHNDIFQRAAAITRAWHNKVNEEFIKVSDQEGRQMWAQVEANVAAWEVSHVQ
jgi:hypothetical protein